MKPVAETDNRRAQINSFAIRMFRDTADSDYMAARVAFRAHLFQPFRWLAIHCLEKYAKGILLLNRISSVGLGHEVTRSLERMAMDGPFQIKLSDVALNFIKMLEEGAQFRYYEISFYADQTHLAKLDLTVSELRRYCQPINVEMGTPEEPFNLQTTLLRQIEHAREKHVTTTCIHHGHLEEVLKKKDHPSRDALVWNNLFFSSSGRKKILMQNFFSGGNAPLYLHPDLIHDVEKLIILNGDLKKQWKAEAAKRAVGGES